MVASGRPIVVSQPLLTCYLAGIIYNSRAMNFLRVVFAAVLTAGLAQTAQAQYAERIDVTAVEIPITVRDRSGRVPQNLTKEDFEVFEDGERQEVIGLSYPPAIAPVVQPGQAPVPTQRQPLASIPARRQYQVVVYIQQSLATTRGLRQAAEELARQSGALAALGDVEIVSDHPTAHVLLPATGDPNAIRKAFEKLAATGAGAETIFQIRRQYELERRRPRAGEMKPLVSAGVMAAMTEAGIVRRVQTQMVDWMARYAAAGPGAQKVLVLVSEGYSLDPENFYVDFDASGANLSDLRSLSASKRQTDIARSLAAQGWTIYSVAAGAQQHSVGTTTEMRDLTMDTSRELPGQAPGTLISTPSTIHDVLEPLQIFSAESGGRIATDVRRIAEDVHAFTERLVLTYQVRRPRDGKLHALKVRSRRDDISIEAPRSVVSGTPEMVATARATAVALGFGQTGELPVTCRLVPGRVDDEEIAEIRVDLASFGAARKTMKSVSLRVTVGVAPEKGLPFTQTQQVDAFDGSVHSEWEVSIPIRGRKKGRAAVVGEEVATGAWGGCVCQKGEALPVASLPSRWRPFAEAMSKAKAENKLVVLYVRGTQPAARADAWIQQAENYEPLRFQLDQMIAARDPDFDRSPELKAYRDSRRPRLLVVDYAGGVVVEVNPAFRDHAQSALVVSSVRDMEGTFALSAQHREEGRIADAMVARGFGLYNAELIDVAFRAFEEANEEAAQTGNRAASQLALIGMSGIRMRNRSRLIATIAEVTEIAKDPASADVAASAWMLIGQARRSLNDRHAAVDAFQKAWNAAPKPSAIATAAKRSLDAVGGAVPGAASGGAGEVRLLFPRRPVQAGGLEIFTAAPAEAARVEIYLDDRRVAESSKRPFRTRIDLGEVPRSQMLKAVAFDASNKRIGEASELLNAIGDRLSVAILQPGAEVETSAIIEIEPRVPQGVTLEAVDVYWNEEKLATLTQAPYRVPLTLPERMASGYVRAVARASNGETAEDAKPINAGGVSEIVRVDAVELFAVVEDRSGHQVDGLTAADFVVKEDGVPVEVEVRSTANDPITVGLVLDGSASMRASMSRVTEVATEFLRTQLRPNDRTFVVSFDDMPHLLQPLTSDLDAARAAVLGIRGSGSSAIWDAAVFALGQLRNVKGKRALLLFTDGVDSGSRTQWDGVIAYAGEVGVPIYVFQMKGEDRTITNLPPGGAPGTNPRFVATPKSDIDWRLQEIADGTGGLRFTFPKLDELPRLFEEVRDDTRGQYVLSYVSPSKKPRGTMRRISVSVPSKRLEVRAPTGYTPR